MSTLTVTDLGPIDQLDIPLPDEGGVVVLRGANGSGKSTAIRGVSKMLGGRVNDLSVRDGAKRATVELDDALLSVTKSRSTTRGELEVTGIESRLDVAALVDPGIIDDEKADAKRIKALVGLTGAKADRTLFYELAGGEGAYAALSIDDDTDDVLLLAARVKRAIESEARKTENRATEFRSQAKTIAAAVADIDVEQPSDAAALEESLVDARTNLATLLKDQEAYQEHAKRTAEARAKLSELGDPPSILSLHQLAIDRDEASQAAAAKVKQLESELAKAREYQNRIAEEADAAWREYNTAKSNSERFEQLKSLVDAVAPLCPTEQTLNAARLQVEQARAASENGALVRRAISERERAEADKQRAAAESKLAGQLRDQASAVDDVLSSLIPEGCALRIEAGRLVTATDRSQSELYSDLSHGERWKIAIDLAADQLDASGLLTIPQEAWEGLSETNRKLVADHCRERGVTALTAAVADSQLTAEVA